MNGSLGRFLALVFVVASLAGCTSSESAAPAPTPQPEAPAPTLVATALPTPSPPSTPQNTVEPAPTTPPPSTPQNTVVPVPTPSAHPWYECEAVDFALTGVDYRVTNIPADDPDGGLVAHISPGVGALVTQVLPDATGELRVSGCQSNLVSGSSWWLLAGTGWVNAHFLESHVPLPGNQWQPGLSDPIDPTFLNTIVGLEAPRLRDLEVLIGQALVGEGFTVIELREFAAVDARGGLAMYDVIGLRDDSISGYRLEVTVDFLKDKTADEIVGFRVQQFIGRALCARGVSGDRCL